MINYSESGLDDIVSAIKDGKLADRPVEPVIVRSMPSPALGELVTPVLDPDGTLKRRFAELIKANETKLEAEAKKTQHAAVENSAGKHTELREASRVWRDGVLGLEGTEVRRDLLDQPFLIWSTVGLDITSEITPGGSWAKFTVDTRESIDENVTFWYLWENPSDQYTVLDVHGYLIANGYAYVQSEGGVLAGYRNSNVQLTAQLRPLQWWVQPATEPPAQDSQLAVALTLGVSTGGYFDDTASAVAQLYRGYDLSYQLFVVPPRASTVFQLVFRVRTSVSQGKALVDFDGGSFGITCPHLLLITRS